MVIVTGGAGFIGSAFVHKLNQEGITDILIVDNIAHTDKWKNLVTLHYTDYIHKDDFITMISHDGLDDVDAIFHLGACSATTETDMDYLMRNNVEYTQILHQWAIENDAYFMYASSAATYGAERQNFDDNHDTIPQLEPINRYGYSKQLFDKYLYTNDSLDSCVGLKFFNVFGPNEYHKDSMRSIVCKAYDQILSTGSVKLFKSYDDDYGHGEQMRDFVYVKDCVDMMWWLYQHPEHKGIFNIGTGQARHWNDLVTAIFNALNKPVNIEYIEMPESIKAHYQYFTQANMVKLQNAGYSNPTTSLEDAVTDYVQNYLSTQRCYSSLDSVLQPMSN